jgi:hypothetical protein
MNITAKMSVVIAAIFALVCFSVAITGFVSSGSIEDPVQRGDGYGFAWFWTFLGTIGVAFGALSVWILKTQKDEDG